MTQDNTSTKQEDQENDPEILEEDEIEIIDAEVEDTSVKEETEEANESDELDSLKKEKDELYDRYLRVQAEYDNYKRRTEKEKISERKYKSLDLANDIIPVIDNFERALQVEVNDANKGIIDGITMVYNQLLEALKTNDVEPMEVEGKEFDPNLHHAVMQTDEADVASNIIVEELQKGYLLTDTVIRPARVKVNKETNYYMKKGDNLK